MICEDVRLGQVGYARLLTGNLPSYMLVGEEVRNVCVIGAGTMGSAIAAHLANLGFRVTLLDLSKDTVQEAFERARKLKPPILMIPERAAEIRLGGIAENIEWVADADWVCEAIVERLDAKRDLYGLIEPQLREDAMISTNTSGLQIELLTQGRSDSFKRRFLGTHFFNPPRYLKLLELIPTPETDAATVRSMTTFLQGQVGRRVVVAKDTPGFIANRYGMWSMFKAIHVAERLHLSVEEVDAITGSFLGRPKSASFRLNDIVGLDVMRDIAGNLIQRCPEDPQIKVLEQPASMHSLLARGWNGDKTGHGYYRRESQGELLVLDLQTFAYRNKLDVVFPSLENLKALPLGQRIASALELRDPVGEFLRHYLVPTLQYATQIQEEISQTVQDFDRVMEWGFGWEMGPFAMIDAIGAHRLGIEAKPFYSGSKMMGSSGKYVATLNEPEFRPLHDYPVIKEGSSYRMRDLGDGVLSVALTTKMGVISPTAVAELTGLLEPGTLKRFVFTSEAKSFSAGFDLKFLLASIEAGQFEEIDQALMALQRLGELLEMSQAVAAVSGYCLGAGLELALSCSHIAASAEAQLGMPEAKVGLIPGGRGTALMRLFNQASAKRLAEVALTLTGGVVAQNAEQARQIGYLRPTDLTVFHPDRLIADAKRLALNAVDGKSPAWNAEPSPLLGMIDRALDQASAHADFTNYDVTIGHKIKQVFVRSTGYEDALIRERVEFLDLCGKALTQTRLRHMIENGKPIRN